MKIQRTHMDTLQLGDLICNMDDDELEDPNEHYDALDQQWDVVMGLRDSQIQLLVVGEPRLVFVSSWSMWTWRAVEDDGVTPVRVSGKYDPHGDEKHRFYEEN